MAILEKTTDGWLAEFSQLKVNPELIDTPKLIKAIAGLNFNSYATQEQLEKSFTDLSETLATVNRTEGQIYMIQQKLQEHSRTIRQHNSDWKRQTTQDQEQDTLIWQLKLQTDQKIDCETFDETLTQLKGGGSALGRKSAVAKGTRKQSNGSLSTGDKQKFRDVVDGFGRMEDEQRKIMKQLRTLNLKDLQEKSVVLEKRMGEFAKKSETDKYIV